jgi:hypothetical protein
MRISTRGPKIGNCNICGSYGKLAEDHIPPKGVLKPRQVEIINFTDMLAVPRPTASSRFSQDGVKYRTLCSECNNLRLGTNYDPALIKLANETKAFLASRLYLPSSTIVQAKSGRVVRSVVGHLLAHGVEQHRTGSAIEELTDYFLDENAIFPKNVRLYHWIYPYNDQIILKGFSISMHFWESFGVCMLLKFFPFSFLFVIDEPPSWRLSFDRLDLGLPKSIDEIARIRLQFNNLPPQRWPECPTDTGMVMHTPGATAAIPRENLFDV